MKFHCFSKVKGQILHEVDLNTKDYDNSKEFFTAATNAVCDIKTNDFKDIFGKVNTKKAWQKKFEKVPVCIYLPTRVCVDIDFIKTAKGITQFYLGAKCVSNNDIIDGFRCFLHEEDINKYDSLNKDFDHIIYFPNASVKVFFANSVNKDDEDFFADRNCEITRETISVPTYSLKELEEGQVPVIFNYGNNLLNKFLELLPDTEMLCEIKSFDSMWETYVVNEQGITPEFWQIQKAILDTRLNDDIVNSYFELACLQGKYCIDVVLDISERLESDKPYKDWNDFVDKSIALTVKDEQELNQGEFMRLDYNEVSKSLRKEFYITKAGYVFKL